ncbi:MAG: hypothetical protein J6V26_06305 [Alistipes sp.]|nr:hypothetical protein [Alistipes sp.]
MKLLVWNDGSVVEASNFSLDRPYVMQRIHTIGHKAFNIAQHIELLREDSMRMFGFASLCDPLDAKRIIEKLLELSRVSPRLSCPVAMRLSVDGALSFEVESPLYDCGMHLRARRFCGVDIVMPAPETLCQTSVSVAIDAMAEAVVSKRGGDVAVWCDNNGDVISLPWRPIFAVYNGRVYTPYEYNTVEYRTVAEAISRLNLELNVRTIPVGSLERMDEVFMADVMAVSSLSAIKNHRLLSAVTLRIVDKMEPKS